MVMSHVIFLQNPPFSLKGQMVHEWLIITENMMNIVFRMFMFCVFLIILLDQKLNTNASTSGLINPSPTDVDHSVMNQFYSATSTHNSHQNGFNLHWRSVFPGYEKLQPHNYNPVAVILMAAIVVVIILVIIIISSWQNVESFHPSAPPPHPFNS